MAETKGGIEVDVKGFKAQVLDFAKKYGIGVRVVMRDQMRLWLVDLIKQTPPKNRGQGVRAIERDLGKLFVPLKIGDALKFFASEFGQESSSGGIPRKQVKATAAKRFPDVIFNWDGNQARMDGYRNRFRNKRGGISKRSRNIYQVKDWTFENKMYVPASAFNKLKRKLSARVGTLKAGWLPGAIQFGAKSPAFVNKVSRKSGFAIDAMKSDGSGFLSVSNQVPWNTRLGKIVVITGRTRERDIKFQLEKRIDKLAARA